MALSRVLRPSHWPWGHTAGCKARVCDANAADCNHGVLVHLWQVCFLWEDGGIDALFVLNIVLYCIFLADT